jgi:hypothetical protein
MPIDREFEALGFLDMNYASVFSFQGLFSSLRVKL